VNRNLMRQGQQSRRGVGRGRMPQKPSTRNYESNGPDVKIRGTAAQIAERYRSLARDAFASGNMVTAESYLQHAEHYHRIIMAAPSQIAPHKNYEAEGPNRGDGFRSSWNADVSDTFGGRPGKEVESGGGGGSEIRHLRDGGRTVPGGEREHGHPERDKGPAAAMPRGQNKPIPTRQTKTPPTR
jgi:hypothetical protein